jgi:hypothetical protein
MSEEPVRLLTAEEILQAVGKGLEVSLALVKATDPERLNYFTALLVGAYGTSKPTLTPEALVRGFLHQRGLLVKEFKSRGHDELLAQLISAPVQANLVALPGVRAAWARIQSDERKEESVARETAADHFVKEEEKDSAEPKT